MTAADERDSGRKRRRDFELNREAILRAADDALAEMGSNVSINEIAKHAGVAPATIYRHFPNKSALVSAVFDLRIVAYAQAVEVAQTESDPGVAFRKTIHAIVGLQARDRSFREIIASQVEHPLEVPGFARFGLALLGALDTARAAGVMRDDVDVADILLLLIATEGIARAVGGHSPSALGRLVDLALDGICDARSELHGPPLTLDQVHDVGRS